MYALAFSLRSLLTAISTPISQSRATQQIATEVLPLFFGSTPKNLSIRLKNNPCIASYVRNLRIAIIGRSAVHHEMPFILSQLSRVESTVLSGNHRIKVPWLNLNDHFRTIFVDHLKLPTIRMIRITGIEGFPLSVFSQCKNLRELSLIGKFTEDDSPSTSSPHSLRHLEVTPQTSPRRFVSWAKTNTLQSLSLDFDNLQYRDIPLFPDILQGFSGTLVNLELQFRHFLSGMSPIFITLPTLEFPVLRCLLVHTHIIFGYDLDDSREMWVSALPATITLVESMANTTNAFHLSLHLQFLSTVPSLATIDWPRSIVTLAAIPIVRHPIKLYISDRGRPMAGNVLSAIKRDPELDRLTKEDKLEIENGPVSFSTLMQ